MGVVYEAFDRERNAPVALKTLKGVDAASLYRLKREFRALADVSHPGLASLHELVSAGDVWFITMELVDGVDFISWVRPGARARADDTAALQPTELLPPARPERVHQAPLSLDRLRAALLKLAEAVHALHEASRMHRDIKPSNVLVTPAGRVVLLDFGLVAEIEQHGHLTTEQGIVGTAAYMAPEQAAAEPITPAADWYAVGVILYEALVGRVPFAGSPVQVLLDKQRLEPVPPIEIDPTAPADLNALCVELLRREPARRPGGPEVLARLRREKPSPVPERSDGRSRRSPVRFVGREKPLARLKSAFEGARAGHAGVVFVHGRSGVGKTALVRHFLDELARSTDAVVLQGRCYERESVPFKALDSLVDALSRHLVRLPREKVEALLPRDVRALARMFPVLRRIEAVADAPRRPVELSDLQELRLRAFAALRELFQRMCDRSPLVLFIDDLQWGDLDSAALLAEVLRPPEPPPLLLVACYRSEDAERSRPIRSLLGTAQQIALEPLTPDEAESLARALLGESAASERARALARESGGNPFFLDALVQHVLSGGWSEQVDVSLDAVVRARTLELAESARALLDVVSVAGRPLPVRVALQAASLDAGDQAALAALKSARLVRGSGEGDAVETYHDRIRETVVDGISPARQAELHVRIARALELSGRPDPEALAFHYGAAGDVSRAARFAAEAAERAAEALAFDRAAALFRRSRELEHDVATAARLAASLGDALANAGRGLQAAEAYLEAASARGLKAAEALDLRRRAAEQLLRSGHIDEGLAAIGGVLDEVGMTLAPTPKRALLALLARRAWLFVRGTRFHERDESQVSAEALTRIDVCWSVGMGLSMVETIRAASFQTRQLLLALQAGEPRRIARALAAEAAFVATTGVRKERRAARLIAEAEALAARVGDPRLEGLVVFSRALMQFLVGRWREAQNLAEAAERIYRDVGSGLIWEAANARLFSVWSLFYLGEVGQLSAWLPRVLTEAQERGDLYAVTSLRSGLANVAHLAADDPELARREVADVMRQWSQRGFHFQHYWGLVSNVLIGLYAGDGRAAYERVREAWPALRRSLLLRIQNVRVEATFLRAAAALAAGLGDEALASARRLERERVGWAEAFAALLRAGISSPDEAAARYRAAAARLESVQMALFAAAARRRAGAFGGGDEGRAAIAAADAFMTAQGVKNPERMTAMLAPRLLAR